MRIKSVAVILVLLIAARIYASDAADSNRGFAADTVFGNGAIDHVNLFNGNLIVDIPLVASFPLDGGASYSIHLVYNGKPWDYEIERDVDNSLLPPMPVPSRRSNAGMGWLVSMGRLITPSDPSNPGCDVTCNNNMSWVYESADGADHVFYATLHPNDTVVANVFYTRDGSFLRMKWGGGATRTVEFPNGMVQTFGNVTGVLQTIATPYDPSNSPSVTVNLLTGGSACQDAGAASCWQIVDWNHNRTQYVTFNDSSGHSEEHRVHKIILTAFGGQTATYSFNYLNNGGAQETQLYTDAHTNCYSMYVNTPPFYFVPLLNSISLPDGSQYVIDQYQDNPPGCSQGSLHTLTLPTLGRLSYVYQINGMEMTPSDNTHPNVFLKERHQQDRSGTDIAVWKYDFALGDVSPYCQIGCAHPWEKREFTVTVKPPPRVMSNGTRQDVFTHYFSVALHTYSDNTAWLPAEYGLPLTHNAAHLPRTSDDGTPRYLSTEVDDCDSNVTNCVVRQQTYVKYELDSTTISSSRAGDNDRREASSVVVSVPDNIFSLTNRTDFDGLGHYRTTTTAGNFPGSNVRTTTTSFNRSDLAVDPAGLPNVGTYPDTFAMLAPSDPWVLNTFTSQITVEGSQTAKRLFCYERTTGFLLRERSLKGLLQPDGSFSGTALDTTDLVQRYTRDSSGNATKEEYFGGETSSVNNSALCSMTFDTPPTYQVNHTYASGALATTTHINPIDQTTVGYKDVDDAIDVNTGLVSQSRDTAGVATNYAYDQSRRLTAVTPVPGCSASPCPAATSYTYTNASGSALAQVQIMRASSGSAGAINRQFQYDDLGRVSVEKKLLPDNTWASRLTTYALNGRKEKASTWAATPTYFTVFSNYDPFGRPATVTAPDGKVTSLAYTGVRAVDRTVLIGAASSQSTTREIYDRFGRLYQVLEPGSTGSPDAPNSTTTYTYDVANRLAQSVMTNATTTQQRVLRYDNRGLLVTETHPENGVTTYGGYDARGHVGTKSFSTQTPYDLTYTYDKGEHLTYLSSRNPYYPNCPPPCPPFRISKEFSYGNSNLGPDLCDGKLVQSKRHNYLPPIGETNVTEAFFYGDAAGHLTSKDTTITNDPGSGPTTLQIFHQEMEYNDLDEVTTQMYPTCMFVGCGARTTDTFTEQYANGFLTGVLGFTDKTSSAGIEYAPSGMVKTVRHARSANAAYGVVDTYAPDTNAIPRPQSITFASDSNSLPRLSPTSGTAAGGVLITVNGSNLSAPSSITVGGLSATSVTFVTSTQITFRTPVLPAGTLNDVVITMTSGSVTVPNGFMADFLDIAGTYIFHDFIEKIFRNNITAGCGGGNYCPDLNLRRDQMAIFVLVAEHGATYHPPPATGLMFTDVHTNTFAAAWIEQLATEGIDTGCGNGNFCPADPITRAQIAVVLLRGKYGRLYTPPPATGIFNDVPPNVFPAAWIEQLYREGVTGGCGTHTYCPNAYVTRGVIAVFLKATFNLAP